MNNIKRLVLLSCLACTVASPSALAQSWVFVFNPETFIRKGSTQPTVYTRRFSATPGPAVVDMDDLGTVGADGSVTLNGVILMDVRAVTGEVGPRHKSAAVTLNASNTLLISLIGKNKSELRVSVAQAVGRNCYPDLPAPELAAGTFRTDGTTDWYGLQVLNSNIYPAELFWPAPDLAPCGVNTNSARTWVSIVEPIGMLILCDLASPTDLNTLWLAVPAGTAPPSPVSIRLVDRYCDLNYTSNPLTLP